jgi:predicted esterase
LWQAVKLFFFLQSLVESFVPSRPFELARRLSILSPSMASSASSSEETTRKTTVRVLALHGSGGTADSFAETLREWNRFLKKDAGTVLDVIAIQAAIHKDDGFCWWSMPPGVRSFNAQSYTGFEESSRLVLEPLSSTQYDLVVGHSQGAILLTALLALDKVPRHPAIGYLLNGVAWPNPYTAELESLQLSEEAPRVLILHGANDKMNPLEQGQRVADALEKAGCSVQVRQHPAGHAVPTPQDEETLSEVATWITSR